MHPFYYLWKAREAPPEARRPHLQQQVREQESKLVKKFDKNDAILKATSDDMHVDMNVWEIKDQIIRGRRVRATVKAMKRVPLHRHPARPTQSVRRQRASNGRQSSGPRHVKFTPDTKGHRTPDDQPDTADVERPSSIEIPSSSRSPSQDEPQPTPTPAPRRPTSPLPAAESGAPSMPAPHLPETPQVRPPTPAVGLRPARLPLPPSPDPSAPTPTVMKPMASSQKKPVNAPAKNGSDSPAKGLGPDKDSETSPSARRLASAIDFAGWRPVRRHVPHSLVYPEVPALPLKEPPPGSEEGPYQCNRCPQDFETYYTYVSHYLDHESMCGGAGPPGTLDPNTREPIRISDEEMEALLAVRRDRAKELTRQRNEAMMAAIALTGTGEEYEALRRGIEESLKTHEQPAQEQPALTGNVTEEEFMAELPESDVDLTGEDLVAGDDEDLVPGDSSGNPITIGSELSETESSEEDEDVEVNDASLSGLG
ncbi:hypothetical protein N0V90_004456 [Kalmusia sp. IMI 367209]|nr:hypothetical protein N0V90_004456 [Kalmusia sp. IMI 367209]